MISPEEEEQKVVEITVFDAQIETLYDQDRAEQGYDDDKYLAPTGSYWDGITLQLMSDGTVRWRK